MSVPTPLSLTLVVACVALAIIPAFAGYLGIGYIFERVWYRRRASVDAWKCQPDRWASPEVRRRELRLASFALLEASLFTAAMMAHVATGGYTAIYLDLEEHGPLFTALSGLAYFVLTDLLLYGMHRLLHVPALYRAFHRTHHQFLSPTAMSMAALHPVELAMLWCCLMLPSFVIPIYAPLLGAVAAAHLLIGMIDHSGVRLHLRWLPWMEPSQFHDDHHRYFHVNFGQCLGTWDRLFGTARRVGNQYSEDDFSPLGQRSDGQDPASAPLLDYRRAPGPVREPEIWSADARLAHKP